MLEFENIFTAKSTSPNASKLEGSAQKPDNKEVSEGAFQTLLEDSKNSDIPQRLAISRRLSLPLRVKINSEIWMEEVSSF